MQMRYLTHVPARVRASRGAFDCDASIGVELHEPIDASSMRSRNNECGALSISAWCFDTTLR